MLIYLLIAVDILAGISLLFSIRYISFLLFVLLLIKASITIISSFKSGFFFEFMGFTDLIGAVSLLLLSKGITFSWFFLVSIALLSKGLFSFLVVK